MDGCVRPSMATASRDTVIALKDLKTLKPLAVARDYSQLQAVVRAVADTRNVTREASDEECHLPPGYSAKLLAPKPMRALGMTSMGPVFALYGLALIVCEDTEALARVSRPVANQRRRRKAVKSGRA